MQYVCRRDNYRLGTAGPDGPAGLAAMQAEDEAIRRRTEQAMESLGAERAEMRELLAADVDVEQHEALLRPVRLRAVLAAALGRGGRALLGRGRGGRARALGRRAADGARAGAPGAGGPARGAGVPFPSPEILVLLFGT